MPDKKKVPLGKPLSLTDKELEDAAEVTIKDIREAALFWWMNAPDGFERLLDAETVEDTSNA